MYNVTNQLDFKHLPISPNSFCCTCTCTCRLYAISTKLSPEQKSSGIQVLEADSFTLHCYQTSTGGIFTV